VFTSHTSEHDVVDGIGIASASLAVERSGAAAIKAVVKISNNECVAVTCDSQSGNEM
jgi:hypothetical protein